MTLGKAPVCLRVKVPPDLCIVGKVDNPESTVKPVTPIEIGVELLFSDDILPNEKVPSLSPLTSNELSIALITAWHIIEPAIPTLLIAWTWYMLSTKVDPIATSDKPVSFLDVIPCPTVVSSMNM